MFDHCLYFNTSALARVLEREWSKAFKPFGLTPAQGFMLRAVLDQPGMLQSKLAEELVISRATASRTLDGLEKLALIERRATKNDGRESEVVATSKAQAIKDGLNAASGEVTLRLKKEMGAAQFEETVAKVKVARSNGI